MGNEIPSAVREGVRFRDMDRCVVCSGKGTEIQHRVRRREGGHGYANLIRICSTCHGDAHRNVAKARKAGVVVPTYYDPEKVPVKTWRGWMYFRNDGSVSFTTAQEAEKVIEDLFG